VAPQNEQCGGDDAVACVARYEASSIAQSLCFDKHDKSKAVVDAVSDLTVELTTGAKHKSRLRPKPRMEMSCQW
jgi:hypothetical protein